MSRAAQKARLDAYAEREMRSRSWFPSAVVTEQVVDLTDAEQFPEMALALEHARKLREAGHV